MNRRQKIKKLKKDNELMRKIINNTPEMARLYDAYNAPANITYTTIPIEQYKCRRSFLRRDLPPTDWTDLYKEELATELLTSIKDNIEFCTRVDLQYMTLEASIFVGKKRTLE